MTVGRKGQVPLTKIAKDFGICNSGLRNWLRAAGVEDGNHSGVSASEAVELRELRRRPPRRPEYGYQFLGDEPGHAGHDRCDRTMWRARADKDVHSERIVGNSIAQQMMSRLAVDALRAAVSRRGGAAVVAGCVVHPDCGLRFRSRKLLAGLRRHDLAGSMGQVASAGDNAAMESFFSLLQKNDLGHRRHRRARLGRLAPSSTKR